MYGVRIAHSEGKMLLFDRCAAVDAEQMYFLFTGLKPGAGKAQIRAVFALKVENVDIKIHSSIDVFHVDGNVMDALGINDGVLVHGYRSSERRSRAARGQPCCTRALALQAGEVLAFSNQLLQQWRWFPNVATVFRLELFDIREDVV